MLICIKEKGFEDVSLAARVPVSGTWPFIQARAFPLTFKLFCSWSEAPHQCAGAWDVYFVLSSTEKQGDAAGHRDGKLLSSLSQIKLPAAQTACCTTTESKHRGNAGHRALPFEKVCCIEQEDPSHIVISERYS